MAVYAITGKLGSGKGKAGIDQIRRYLNAGKRVATNCDVFLEHLLPRENRATIIRVPDKPRSVDLYMCGSGNRYIDFQPILSEANGVFCAAAPLPQLLPGFDECHNGALVLDECGSWLNTRDFQDKGRKEMLEWAIHARKYGWDIFFIMQNISQVDKQLRDSLLEYVVRLNRLDRMRVPLLSGAVKLMTAGAFDGSMPRLHIGVVRLGSSPDALVADRWIFRGDDLNAAYNTTQVFSEAYPHAIHSLLSSWHLSASVGVPAGFVGPVRPCRSDEILINARPLPPKPPYRHMSKLLVFTLLLGGVLGIFGSKVYGHLSPSSSASVAAVAPVFSDTLRGVGFMRTGGVVSAVTLSDGRTVNPMRFRIVGGNWEAQISDTVWVRGPL